MVNIKFETLYFSNYKESIVSSWDCSVELTDSKQHCFDLKEAVFILPPNNAPLQILINFVFGSERRSINCLEKVILPNIEFWHKDLNYMMESRIKGSSLILSLKCNHFNEMKVNKLFYKPKSLQLSRDYHILFLPHVKIQAAFHSTDDIDPKTVQNHLNEYVSSLLVSQLEFQFPLVFSKNCRNKFAQHERSMGSVACSLGGDCSLISNISEIISRDSTSTLIFQVLDNRQNKTKGKRSGSELNSHKPFMRS
ncbi:HGR017Wp [Eremothecium sinecaudum]|uniref:HGR017Wp n=1 Tax=Eremothecium sinecaudum TaxID=45286 RepID=A0A0X8HVN3_9SACH|nr:HGR017Wp [Eremothecium sinecaudum]AMD22356.1 HGR017Wp [Eremothecium sinecaudum]